MAQRESPAKIDRCSEEHEVTGHGVDRGAEVGHLLGVIAKGWEYGAECWEITEYPLDATPGVRPRIDQRRAELSGRQLRRARRLATMRQGRSVLHR
jgi:hypothetical protein